MRVLSDANASYQVLGLPIANGPLGLEGLETQHYRIEAVALEMRAWVTPAVAPASA